MVSKPFVCDNNETAGGIKVEELPGNFGHPWATKNWGQPLFVWYPTYFAGLQFLALIELSCPDSASYS